MYHIGFPLTELDIPVQLGYSDTQGSRLSTWHSEQTPQRFFEVGSKACFA